MDKYKNQSIWNISLACILIIAISGCTTGVLLPVQRDTIPTSTSTTQPTDTAAPEIPQTAGATATVEERTEPTDAPVSAPVSAPAVRKGVIYQDDFTDPKSGWPESLKFDNYFIGYHEPSSFHVDVHSPNDRAVVTLQKQTFRDLTLESKMFTEPNNTAPEGSYRYGLVFRRSGSQYYAFTVTPQDQTWQLIKVSPGGTQELRSGSQETINERTGNNTLRVDVKETAFYLWINNQLVAQASDIDYGSGEVGFYVETFDSPRVHIHFDTVTVREVEIASEQKGIVYQDDFIDPKSGWPESLTFDNYFIGYHEPSFFHIDIHAPYDRAVVALQDDVFTDFTLESRLFTETNNTAPEGSYRYGLVFRRSGSQYYAFTITPGNNRWHLLKVTPDSTQELMGGSQDMIQGQAGTNILRVDVKGPEFFLRINDQLVAQANDADYASGEVGFYVETFDNPRVHIHFDTITVREAQIPEYRCQVTVQGLNLREGPSINAQVAATARYLDRFEPLARSQDGLWLQVRLENQFRLGWVSNSDEYFSCSVAVDDLPIRLP